METFRQHAQEYQLHTCQHCEKFIVDTAKAANSTNRETSLGSFHIPGAQVFTAATNTCGLFQACIVTLKNDLTRRLLVDAVTEEIACQFTLVVTLWYIRRADGGHGMTLEGAWRRDEPRGWLTDGVTRFNLWPRKGKLSGPGSLIVPNCTARCSHNGQIYVTCGSAGCQLLKVILDNANVAK